MKGEFSLKCEWYFFLGRRWGVSVSVNARCVLFRNNSSVHHKEWTWPADARQALTLFQWSTINAKGSETIHGKIWVDKNQHSFSLPSSCLHIWWSRMTAAHTLFGINLNGNCSQRYRVLARSSSLNVLAHHSMTKEAKTNSLPQSPGASRRLLAMGRSADRLLLRRCALSCLGDSWQMEAEVGHACSHMRW